MEIIRKGSNLIRGKVKLYDVWIMFLHHRNKVIRKLVDVAVPADHRKFARPSSANKTSANNKAFTATGECQRTQDSACKWSAPLQGVHEEAQPSWRQTLITTTNYTLDQRLCAGHPALAMGAKGIAITLVSWKVSGSRTTRRHEQGMCATWFTEVCCIMGSHCSREVQCIHHACNHKKCTIAHEAGFV